MGLLLLAGRLNRCRSNQIHVVYEYADGETKGKMHMRWITVRRGRSGCLRLLRRDDTKGHCHGVPQQYTSNSVQLPFIAETFINSSDTLKIFDWLSCEEGSVCVLDTVAYRAKAKRKLQMKSKEKLQMKSKEKIADWQVLLLLTALQVLLLLTALHLSQPKDPTRHNCRNL